MDTKSRSERGWRIAVAAFVLVLVAMAGAAIVFLTLAADVMRDEAVLRQRGQVTSATVLEINRSERRKNLPAQVVIAYVGPEPVGRVEVRGAPDGIDVGAVVPVLYDPQDPSRARIATVGWPVMDVLLLLLGVGVSALLPVAMLRVWLQGRRRLSARRGVGSNQRSRRRSICGTRPQRHRRRNDDARSVVACSGSTRKEKEEWDDDDGPRAGERAGDRTSGGGDAA